MTEMQVARYPVAPTVTPRRGTLLDVAPPSNRFAWMDGRDLFESYNCMTFGSTAEFCAPNEKDFDNTVNWVDGIKFAAYGGVMCKAVGLDQADMKAQVERVFRQGESTAVERGVMAQRFIEEATLWGDAPADINSAGAVTPKVGLALLEEHAAANYVGVPTLHLPVSIASLLTADSVLEFEGNMLRSELGSKVVAGAGYAYPNLSPTGTAAAAGTRWLYATGEVVVAASELEIRQVMDPTSNEVYALGERGYVVAVDCYTAAVRVSVSS